MMTLLMINVKTMLILAIVCVIAVSCARMFTRGNSGDGNRMLTAFSNVNVDEFQAFIADPNVQLLDVRTADEYSDGHIAGSTLVDVNEADFLPRAMAVLDSALWPSIAAAGAAVPVLPASLPSRVTRSPTSMAV